MPNWLKHVGMAVGGAVCIAAGVFFPPVAPILGPIGTKLVLAGGGTLLVAAASPEHIKDAINVIKSVKAPK